MGGARSETTHRVVSNLYITIYETWGAHAPGAPRFLHLCSDSLLSTEETKQDRLRLPESLLLLLKVADCSLFDAQGMRSTFLSDVTFNHAHLAPKPDEATMHAITVKTNLVFC